MTRANLLLGVFIALVAACEPFGREGVGSSPAQLHAQRNESGNALTYDAHLSAMNVRIADLTRLAGDRPDDWLIRGRLAGLLLERAGLTGSYEDFAETGAVLDDAIALAAEGSGPLLAAAQYNFAIHRLDVAESYLDTIDARPAARSSERAGVQRLRSQIAMQRGQYDAAYALLLELDDREPGTVDAELALYFKEVGDAALADTYLVDALASAKPDDVRRRAWLHLQRGSLAMSTGQSAAALAEYEAAERELPGWWMTEEHLAQAHDGAGEHDKAVELYTAAYRRAELPQLLDALASSYRHMKREAEATEASDKAARAWSDLIARFPEAAVGHGLDHELRYGTPQRALELAKANFTLRPNGDAHVALARAYLKDGEPKEALDIAKRALETPYRSAALHDVTARALEALGRRAEAEAQMSLSIEMNPLYTPDGHFH